MFEATAWAGRAALAVAALLAASVALTRARAAPFEELGGYESQALREVLERGYFELHPAPDGMPVGGIHVVNLPVFASDETGLTWLNRLHVTTKPYILAREVLVRPGALWDQALIDETERHVRDPLVTTVVVIVPVRSALPDHVDVLVVTRDVWSLRTNSTFEVQDGVLTKLSLALAENNLAGRRKQVALVLDLDLGAVFAGPRFIDPNIGGTRLALEAEAGAVFNRDSGAFEGTRGVVELAYPLWSLDRHWGGLLRIERDDVIERTFQGSSLLTYDDPRTEATEAVARSFRRRDLVVRALSQRQNRWRDLVWTLSFGHELRSQRPAVLADFPDDDALRESFVDDVLPRSERSSALVLGAQLSWAEFITYRDIDSYDLPEVRRVGPDVAVEVAPALEPLGSEAAFVRTAIKADWRVDLGGDAWLRTSVGASNRVQGGSSFDNELSAQINGVTPRFRGLRLVASARGAVQTRERENRLLILGGENGMRGYEVGAFTGNALVATNVELRSLPRRWWFMRWGGVVFWDMGDAATSIRALSPHHDVGVGLRVLWPQTGLSLYRIDWAFPLNGPTVGWLGRLSIGFGQAF